MTTLLAKGASQHEIGLVTGIDRKTIRAYQQRLAEEQANSPRVATGLAQQIPPPWPPGCGDHDALGMQGPHREFIEAQVRLRCNATAIWDLVDVRSASTAAWQLIRRRAPAGRERTGQFDRLEFAPGEEVQVDYGRRRADPVARHRPRYRKPRLLRDDPLRYSRHRHKRVVWKSSQETWARLHEEAWRYFGGSCRYVVLDNLKEGVIKPDLYEPELNPVYAATLAHYGVVADPAGRWPQPQGQCRERHRPHPGERRSRNRRFESIEEQNEFLEHWETKWAAPRIHGSARRQVQAMFEEERAHLQPLPLTGMQFFTEAQRTVCDDSCVRIEHSSYAARPATIGSQVLVRLFEHRIEIRDLRTQALLRTHTRVDRPGTVVLPMAERVFNPSRETLNILNQARSIGPAAQQLCETLFAVQGRVGQRTLWGIVGLARRNPRRLVERACARAIADGVHSYGHIKSLTERLLAEALASIDAATSHAADRAELTQSHALIRPGDDYAQLFTQAAQRQAALPFTSEEHAP